MTSTERPDEHEMAVLRNLEAGKRFEHGLDQTIAVRAMFRCLTKGWVSSSRLTEAGINIIKPAKGDYIITVIKDPNPS